MDQDEAAGDISNILGLGDDTPADAPQEQPTQTPAPEPQTQTDETPSEEPVEPSQAAPQEPTEDPAQIEQIDWTQFLPEVEAQPLPEVGEDGLIDPTEYAESLKSQIMSEVMDTLKFNQNEAKSWQAAEQVLPEIRTNPELRQLVYNTRVGDIANGGQGDAVAAATAIKNLMSSERAAGQAQEQTSVTIQKAAALETGAQVNAAPATNNDYLSRLKAGDQSVTVNLVEQWIEEGLI